MSAPLSPSHLSSVVGRVMLRRKSLQEDLRMRLKDRLLHLDSEDGETTDTFLPDPVSTVQDIWRERDFELLFPNSFGNNEKCELRETALICLSILVYIEWDLISNGSHLMNLFFGRNKLRDSELPIHTSRLKILPSPYAKEFHSIQRIFMPLIITENSGDPPKPLGGTTRWPFLDKPKTVGNGSFGKVEKVTVARRCLEYEHGLTNRHPTVLARKTLEIPEIDKRTGVMTTWYREIQSLLSLRGSRTRHENICIHFAIYGEEMDEKSDSKIYIFSHFAELGDLDTFLRGGNKKVSFDDTIPPQQVYDFKKTFPEWQPEQLLEELENLAGALKFLHEELPSHTRDGVHGAHLDLKPKNILVFGKPGTKGSVGTWKITDFGISSFKQSSSFSASQTQGSRTTRGYEQSYHAPEQHVLRQGQNLDKTMRPGRKTDIWAFGCVVNDVLAFFIGSIPGTLQEAPEQTYLDFWKSKKRNDVDYWCEINAANGEPRMPLTPRLAVQVEDWLLNISQPVSGRSSKHQSCIQGLVGMLKKSFQILPDHRPTASQNAEQLKKIVRDLSGEKSSSKPRTIPVSMSTSEAPSTRPKTVLIPDSGSLDARTLDPISRSGSSASEIPSESGDNISPIMLAAQRMTADQQRISRPIKPANHFFREPWKFTIEPAGIVVLFVISRTAEKAAFITDDGISYKLSVLDIGDAKATPSVSVVPRRMDGVRLSYSIKWDQAQLSSQYLLLIASHGENKSQATGCVIDIANDRVILLPDAWPRPCHHPTISSTGHLAWVADNRILTQDLNRVSPNIITLFEQPGITFLQYNVDNTYLIFQYAYRGKRTIRAIATRRVSLPPLIGVYTHEIPASSQDSLWIAQSKPFCLIQQSNSARQRLELSEPGGVVPQPQQIERNDSAPKPAISETLLGDEWVVTAIGEPKLFSAKQRIRLKKGYFSASSESSSQRLVDVDETLSDSILVKDKFQIAAYENTSDGTERVVLIALEATEGYVYIWER